MTCQHVAKAKYHTVVLSITLQINSHAFVRDILNRRQCHVNAHAALLQYIDQRISYCIILHIILHIVLHMKYFGVAQYIVPSYCMSYSIILHIILHHTAHHIASYCISYCLSYCMSYCILRSMILYHIASYCMYKQTNKPHHRSHGHPSPPKLLHHSPTNPSSRPRYQNHPYTACQVTW